MQDESFQFAKRHAAYENMSLQKEVQCLFCGKKGKEGIDQSGKSKEGKQREAIPGPAAVGSDQID